MKNLVNFVTVCLMLWFVGHAWLTGGPWLRLAVLVYGVIALLSVGVGVGSALAKEKKV